MIAGQSRFAVLLVIALVALAGCTGGGGGDGGAATTTVGSGSGDDPATTTTETRSGGGVDDEVPEGTFEFDYDGEAGTLTITFVGGDNIPADQLRIEGTDFGGNGGIWIELPGAEANLKVAGEQSLGLQDSVTIGAAEGQSPVPANYAVELVYVSDDGTTTTVIASHTGPDA